MMNKLVFALVIVVSQALVEGSRDESQTRVKRTFLKKKLCYLLGSCGGNGDYNNGYGGYNGGYGGYNGGYGGYPSPINIGITQTQSSASAGGGGYGGGYYPNNYQSNGGYGGQGGYGAYGHRRPGYYNNGYGANNNQFNGNYYGGNGGPNGYGGPSGYGGPNGFGGSNGYGYQVPFGNYYDEDGRPTRDVDEDGSDYDGFGRDASGTSKKDN